MVRRMATVQFQQDMQTGEINNEMDTATTLTHSEEMSPSFSQNLSATPHLPSVSQLQDTTCVFPNPSSLLMHMPIADPAPTVYMTPMDVIPMPPLPSGTFLTDMPTCEPFTLAPPIGNGVNAQTTNSHKVSASPQSQIPPPSIHPNTSAYSLGAVSSLESALDQPIVPALPIGTPGVTVSGMTFVSPPTTVVPFFSGDAVMGKQEEVSSEAVAESVVAVKRMLAE